jgi:rod shape-determining protein MreC
MTTRTRTGPFRRRTYTRRLAIIGLALACLALFTFYFRESDSGPLHSVQDAAGGVVAPIQTVAARAIEPAQDAWTWTRDTNAARSRAADLEEENAKLRAELVAARAGDDRAETTRGIATAGSAFTRDYERVPARVIAKSEPAWYERSRIDVGTSDGVVVNSPVIAPAEGGAALVGVVTAARSGSADVTYITDPQSRVGAIVVGAGNQPGILEATTSGQLKLEGVPRDAAVEEGQFVVTGGFSSLQLPSVYPPDLQIGQVTGVGSQETDIEQSIQVTPFVDTRSLREVVALAPASPRAVRRAQG